MLDPTAAASKDQPSALPEFVSQLVFGIGPITNRVLRNGSLTPNVGAVRRDPFDPLRRVEAS
jgi:hypothetical protein